MQPKHAKRRQSRLLFVAIPFGLLLAALSFVFFRAQRTLTQVTRNTGRSLLFTLRPLETSPHPSPFRPVASAPAFQVGVALAGTLYLGGPAGLSIYAADGTLRRTLHTGLELPIAPITGIFIGRLRGASGPQVLISTAGAGVLILDPDATPDRAPNPSSRSIALQQLLPAAAGAADLTALLPLPSGDLLLGSRRAGVFLFTGSALAPVTFTLPGTDPATLQVTALAQTDATSYLIGTRNQGVFYSHAGTILHADRASGLPDDDVESLAATSTAAFVGTPLGVAQFTLPAEPFQPVRILADGHFAHALQLQQESLSVGTLDEGVVAIALGSIPRLRTSSFIHAGVSALGSPDTQSKPRIDWFIPLGAATVVLADGNPRLLSSAGSQGFGVADPASTLTDRNISALAFDPQGRLFIGYFDRGLDILSGILSGNQQTHLEDDSLFCINRLVLDPLRQTIAAATANGLVLFDERGTPRQTLTRRDGLLSDHITDIAFTRTGTVLATPAGITFLTAAGAESLYAFQGLVNNHVYALAASPADTHVLAGTLGGLSLLDQDHVTRNLTITNSGLRHNWITALVPIGSGDTLIGTYGAGLQILSAQGVITPVDLPAGSPRDLVINPNALLATPTHLYAGTLGHGLLVYTVATGRWRLIAEGLPSLNVTAFATRQGELYIGTENGLVHTPESAL